MGSLNIKFATIVLTIFDERSVRFVFDGSGMRAFGVVLSSVASQTGGSLATQRIEGSTLYGTED
jgi:hypothetical protein